MANSRMPNPHRHRARNALHRRLREADPDHTPPPRQSASELLKEKLILFAVFAAVAVVIAVVVVLDL